MNYCRHKYKEEHRFSIIKQELFFIFGPKRAQIDKKLDSPIAFPA